MTKMLQGRRDKVVKMLLYHDCIGLLEQPCNKSDNINKVVTNCSKRVENVGQAVRTQLVDSMFANLLQDVRFLHVYRTVHAKILLEI
jgi:hypothetical protein